MFLSFIFDVVIHIHNPHQFSDWQTWAFQDDSNQGFAVRNIEAIACTNPGANLPFSRLVEIGFT